MFCKHCFWVQSDAQVVEQNVGMLRKLNIFWLLSRCRLGKL